MRIWFAFKMAAVAGGLLGFASVANGGETFRSLRGKEFRNCEVIGKDPHGVTFKHAGGLAKVAFADLSKDLQQRFQYDEVESKRFVDSHRPKRAAAKSPDAKRPVVASANASQVAGFLSSYPRGRGRGVRNPYALTGSLHNPAAYGASFGGFVQPYYSGSFGTPALVTAFPGGFFTPNTLRVGARPILESPVAVGMSSYSQVRDARASAVRAAARATTPAHRPAPAMSHGRSRGLRR